MDSVTVNLKELVEMVNKLAKDKMEFVEIRLDEPLDPVDEDDDDIIPAAVNFTAWTTNQSFMRVDYGPVDAVEDSE